MIGISIGMMLDEERARLFVTSFGNQPSRALGDEPCAEHDERRARGLQPKGKTPFDVSSQVDIAAVDGFASQQSTELKCVRLGRTY